MVLEQESQDIALVITSLTQVRAQDKSIKKSGPCGSKSRFIIVDPYPTLEGKIENVTLTEFFNVLIQLNTTSSAEEDAGIEPRTVATFGIGSQSL